MSGFLGRSLNPIIKRAIPLDPPAFSFLRWISSNTNPNPNSFTVSYLVNSCGLSSESALSASHYVHFETPEKPDAVLGFLKKVGLTQPQISTLVKNHPPVLVCNTEETIGRKVEFFRSKGFSTSDIAKVLTHCPWLVARSLDNLIIRNFDFLKNFLRSDKGVVTAIRRFPYIIISGGVTRVTPRVKFLRESGVPESAIVKILGRYPGIIVMMNLDKLKKILQELMNVGIDPSKPQFVEAVGTLKGMSKFTWTRKVDVFKRWGLSEEEILDAFRRKPCIMATSVDKITAVMDLLVNKLGWEPSVISRRPILLTLSLEERLIPRALILQFLLSKNLLKNDFREVSFFEKTEAIFLEKFVNCYAEAPEMLKLLHKKSDHPK